MRVDVGYEFLPKTASLRSSQVMDHFGIGFEVGRKVIADGLDLQIRKGEIVCFTGESGAGKSSLMRAVAKKMEGVTDLNELQLREEPLIDHLGLSFEEGVELLSGCGLSEARLMLRTPAELSDGERYRFRLAMGLVQQGEWLVGDEFTATLDRTLARVVAYNLQKRARRMGKGVLVATTHEDIVGDLNPDVHVDCRLEGIEVRRLGSEGDGAAKKKYAALRSGCRLRPERNGTGRIFLSGITGVTRSAS